MFPIEALWDCAEKSLVREVGDLRDIDWEFEAFRRGVRPVVPRRVNWGF